MPATLLTGTVQSGSTPGIAPLAGAIVTACEATTAGPVVFGSARADGEGRFSIAVPRDTSESIFYATASFGSGVFLVAVLGPRLPTSVTINELTTVAAAFSMAQFAGNQRIAGDAFGLRIAAGMNDNLVSPATGTSSEVLLASPNGDETNSLRSTRTLANLLGASVRTEPGAIDTLFALTTPPGGTPPFDTFQALVNIARYPGNNVADIYTQAKRVEIYTPSLARAPDAWTLAVKVNDSGDDAYLFGGPGNIVFDRNGYAWVTNNVVQGTPYSAECIMVLQPNGKPSDGSNGTPRSPVFGGGLLGTGFGIDIDSRGYVWVGNFGWGGVEPPVGSVSFFGPGGEVLSQDPFTSGTHRVQGTVVDADQNVWLASFENNRVIVFPRGNPGFAFGYQEDPDSCPFGIAMGSDGSAWVTNSGGMKPGGESTVGRYRIQDGKMQRVMHRELGHSLKGLGVDSSGNAWIAAGGDDVVYLLNPEGEVLGSFGGGGIISPWSATVDGNDNVWVANFGRMEHGSNYTTASITHLAGSNPATRPPGLQTGDAISPPTGYTLPSAGSQVLLHNGDPLYGPGAPPSHCPLMRMTNCVIDQAGNVWVTNNWKPSFDVDVPPNQGNPGGDGIVIFVGLAKPPAKKH